MNYLYQRTKHYPIIPKHEKLLLVTRAKTGDRQAMNMLIKSHVKFISTIVCTNYKGSGVPFKDLISAGCQGLATAVEKFDDPEGRGLEFTSYAVWWIRASILEEINVWNTIRHPANYNGLLKKFDKAESSLRVELGRDPTIMEMVNKTGLSKEVVEKLSRYKDNKNLCSLDSHEFGDKCKRMIDNRVASPDEGVERESLKRYARSGLNVLKGNELRVVNMLFGLDGREPIDQVAASDLMGISYERVRQIKKNAFKKMRGYFNREKLAREYGIET